MHGRILIVEDDAMIAMLVEDYLHQLGCRSSGVVNALGPALALVEAGEVDAAILDVHLAGGETSGSIAAELIQRDIPFLVSTGGFIHSPEAVYAGRPLLLKPFTCDSLAKALGDLALEVTQSREISPQIRGGLEL